MPKPRLIDVDLVLETARTLSQELDRPVSAQEIAEKMGPDRVTKKLWSRQAILAILNTTEEGRKHVEWYNSVRRRRKPQTIICTGDRKDDKIIQWLRSQKIVGQVFTLKDLTPERIQNRLIVTTVLEPEIVVYARQIWVVTMPDGLSYDRSPRKDLLRDAKLSGFVVKGTEAYWS